MKKRSSKGKAYFYAKGQRDYTNDRGETASKIAKLKKIGPWAYKSYQDGYCDSFPF